jgi:hypothetical protein
MSIKFKRKIVQPINDLQFGDIVFIDDRSILNIAARMIRYVERGGKIDGKLFIPNHVMMIKDENPDIDEIVLAQADYNGVKPKKFKLWLNHSKVNVIVKRYPKTLTNEEKRIMRTWTIQQEFKGYDWAALIGIYLQYLLVRYSKSEWLGKIIKAIKNPFNIANRLICSEYIMMIYQQVKIQLCKHCQPSNSTPYDIYKNTKLKEIWRKTNYSYVKGAPIK